jgi:N-acetylgalactosamine kinase
MRSEVHSITLAAGVGRRMPQDMPPKPCCKIGPLSVIENALQTYEEAGIDRHVVVVGHRAEQIMAEVCRTRPDVLFAFQSGPRGTGDAVRCALDLLDGIGPPRHVLISAGDKVVAPEVVRGLLETYAASEVDLCMVVGPSQHYPGSGRIVGREGMPPAIIEVPDIKVRQLAASLRGMPRGRRPRTGAELRELASTYITDPAKLAACFPALNALLDSDTLSWAAVEAAAASVPDGFDVPGGRISPDEAADAPLSNLSVYLGRFDVLHNAVHILRSDNVQGECYFTDVVAILAAAGRKVSAFRIEEPEQVMAFNTLEQLEQIRRVHARRAQQKVRYPTLQRWANYFDRHEPGGLAAQAAKGLAEKMGEQKEAVVIRSPGRINLMGRHVDHQGGVCNLMAIDREIVIAASPREDNQVNLWNLDSASYPFRTFAFSELTGDIVWEDWLQALDSQFVQRLASKASGDWSNYVRGAALRLQHRFPDRPLRGMDAVVCGNIPAAAGLSSSSALVVAAAEALSELNALNIRPREFVDLCGEGEWFVGTRGGSADHAAIKLGREKEVVSISFFPFELIGHHPFPEGYSLMVCHSGIEARKGENARARFNARVACYHMAREILKREFPAFAPLVEHLRDVNTERLDISLPALYRLLMRVPTRVTPAEVEAMARQFPLVDKCVRNLDLDQLDFPLRDVALYGLAECERSSRTGALLNGGDAAAVGRMMAVSHDGDRVARWQPGCTDFDNHTTDERICSLIEQALSPGALSSSGAALWQQPGAYGCSTPKIDLMVDRVTGCPEVIGAQLAGAGLGGCIMILVRDEGIEKVRQVLEAQYYEPEGIEPRLFVCRPSRGSQVLTSVEADE